MDRREQITAEITARTGIDEPMIERLVRSFYARIRGDALLGPIFEARIRDWEPHLQRMCAFWSSVALMSGRYHGSPMTRHLPLPVDAVHFDRWLALFEETAREVCPPEAMARFIERARRIAESLELGIAGRHGVMLGKGERFRIGRRLEGEGDALTVDESIGAAAGSRPTGELTDQRRNTVTHENDNQDALARAAADPRSGSSLVPMLVIGLVLTVVGMFAAVALS